MLNRKQNNPPSILIYPSGKSTGRNSQMYFRVECNRTGEIPPTGWGLFGIGRFGQRSRQVPRIPASCTDLSCCIFLRRCKAVQGNQRSGADLPRVAAVRFPFGLGGCPNAALESNHSRRYVRVSRLMTNVTRRELVCPASTTLSNRQERCSVMPAIRAFSHSGMPFIRDHNTRNP